MPDNFLKSTILILISVCLVFSVKNVEAKEKGEYLVCFGDSFIEGLGVSAIESFPYLLSKKVNLNVINAGVAGNTAADGLKRLEKDVLHYNPRIVLVEFGTNDYYKGVKAKEFERNLESIVEKLQSQNVTVVLLSVQFASMSDEFYDIYARVAEKYSLTLVPNIMKDIFEYPQRKVDAFHPNGEGYRIITDLVYEKIKPLL